MSTPSEFLHGMARGISALGLYGEGHAARENAIDLLYGQMLDLLQEAGRVSISFLDDEVVFGDRPLRDMKGWDLGSRLSGMGIQRIEIRGGASREELITCLAELAAVLSGRLKVEAIEPEDQVDIRYGPASLLDGSTGIHSMFSLSEQSGMTEGLYEEARRSGQVSPGLVNDVLASLRSAMRPDGGDLQLPLIPQTGNDALSTSRSMNTSVIAMGIGEFLNLPDQEIRIVGEAALLHDLGKVVVPPEILNKPGKLTDEEWKEIERHPAEGARILMRSDEAFDLAAIAAFEHHLDLDGQGYPRLHYSRAPHRISQLVRLCDAYDAMRTLRPHEGPLPEEEIRRVLTEGSGKKFAPDLVTALLSVVGQWKDRILPADIGHGPG